MPVQWTLQTPKHNARSAQSSRANPDDTRTRQDVATEVGNSRSQAGRSLQPRACSTKLTKNFFHSLRSAPSSRATYSSIMASGKPMSRISVPFKKR